MQLDKYFIRALILCGIFIVIKPEMGLVLMLALIVLLVLGHR